ncbi:MAG: class I SAM-dependent methyltransferase, partial [Acidimicrobiia bacterium]
MRPDAPFDQYQRYRIAAEIGGFCRQTAGGLPRVLDVGGSFHDLNGHPRLPIQEFLCDSFCVTVDVSLNPLQNYARARGDALPFADRAFQLVTCLDVLEHVPRDERLTLLREVSRASSRAIVVAAPFDDPLIRRAEDMLSGFISRTCGFVQEQLKEHRELGLPSLDETRRQLETIGWSLCVFPYGNLWRWLCMMIDKHAIVAVPGSHLTHQHLYAHFNHEIFVRDRET